MIESYAIEFTSHTVPEGVSCNSGLIFFIITSYVVAGGVGPQEMLGASSGAIRSRNNL